MGRGSREDRLGEVIDRSQGGGDSLAIRVVVIIGTSAIAGAFVGIDGAVHRGPFDVGGVGEQLAIGDGGKQGGIIGEGDEVTRGEVEPTGRFDNAGGGDGEPRGNVDVVGVTQGGEGGSGEAHLSRQGVRERDVEGVDVAGVIDHDLVGDGVGGVGIGGNVGDGLGDGDGGFDDLDVDVGGAEDGVIGTAIVVGVFQQGQGGGVVDDVPVLVFEHIDDDGVDEDADLLVGGAGGGGGIVDDGAEVEEHLVDEGIEIAVGQRRDGQRHGQRGADFNADIADIQEAVGEGEEILDDDAIGGAAAHLGGELVGDGFADDEVLDGGISAIGAAGVGRGSREDRLGEVIDRSQIGCNHRGVALCIIIGSSPGSGSFLGVARVGAVRQVGTFQRGPCRGCAVDQALPVGHRGEDFRVVGDRDGIPGRQIEGPDLVDGVGGDGEPRSHIGPTDGSHRCKGAGQEIQAGRNHVAEGRLERVDSGVVGDHDLVADDVPGVRIGRHTGDHLVDRQCGFDNFHTDTGGADHDIVRCSVVVGIFQHGELPGVGDHVTALVGTHIHDHGINEDADLLVRRSRAARRIVDDRSESQTDLVFEGVGVAIADHR